MSQKEFRIDRHLAAPLDKVWQVHTELDHLKPWWGPKGFPLHFATLDLRPGGHFRYGMRSAQGQEMWGRFTYLEIVPKERLSFLVSFTDPEGNPIRSPFSDTWPMAMRNTTSFAKRNGGTDLTVRSVAHEATPEEEATFAAGFESMTAGYSGTLDQLAAYLAR